MGSRRTKHRSAKSRQSRRQLGFESLEGRIVFSGSSVLDEGATLELVSTAPVQAALIDDSLIPTLNYTQFEQLTAAQIPLLSNAQVASIPDAYWLGRIPSLARAAFTTAQVRSLNVGSTGIELLTSGQIGVLLAPQVQSLSWSQFRFLPAAQVPNLTGAQLQTIPDSGQFGAWSPSARAALTTTQVQSLNVGNVGLSLLTAQQRTVLTVGQIQQARYYDFQYLSATQAAYLSPAQVATIPSYDSFNDMSAAARAALGASQVQALNINTIGLSLLTSTQIGSLTTAQVQQAKYYDFFLLNPSQISVLTGAQLATIQNSSVLSAWSAAQLGALSGPQIQNLDMPNLRIHWFTPAQNAWLTVAQIQTLPYFDFTYLTGPQIGQLTTSQIATIPNSSVLAGWSAATRGGLTATQIPALGMPDLRIHNLTPTQIAALTTAQIQRLPYYDFTYLSPSQTPHLSPAQVASIPNHGAFLAIPAASRAALTYSQIVALNVANLGISLLTAQQIGYLTTAQIQSLSYANFQYLSASQIPVLTLGQIASIPQFDALTSWTPAARAALNAAQIQSLEMPDLRLHLFTKTQVAALTSAQLHSLRYFDLPYLEAWQVPLVGPAQFAEVNTADILRGLSDAQQAALTRAQLLNLPKSVFASFTHIVSATPPSSYVPAVDQTYDAQGVPQDPHLAADDAKVLALVPTSSATHYTVASGNWYNPATWANGVIPGAGAKVWITPGTTVLFDVVMVNSLDTLRIDGTLNFATDRDTRLKLQTMVVTSQGTLTIGTAANPVRSGYTATVMIADAGPINTVLDPYVLGRGLISRGSVDMYGEYVTPYVALAVDPVAGATQLVLTQTPIHWRVGDELVIAGTNQNTADFGTDRVIIRAINGNRVTIDPLRYTHDAPNGLGLQVHVANLARNVVFTAEDLNIPVNEKPHMMFMHNPNVSLDNIGVYGFGRTDKSYRINDPVVVNNVLQPGTGLNARGRYAVHIHMAGVNPAFAPATIRGSVVTDSAGWGFVNHSSNVEMTNNVAFSVYGASFVTENGNEIGTMRGNLAINSYGNADGQPERRDIHDYGFRGHGFWLQGPGVELINNIAAGSKSGAFFYFTGSSKVLFDAVNMDNPALAGGQKAIPLGAVPLAKFEGNVAYASGSGLEVWNSLTMMTDGESVIDRFTSWNSRFSAINISYAGHIVVRGARLFGNFATFAGSGIETNRWTHDIRFEHNFIMGFEIGIDVPVRRNATIIGGYYLTVQGIYIEKGHDTTRSVFIGGPMYHVSPSTTKLAGRTAYKIYLDGAVDFADLQDRSIASILATDNIQYAGLDGSVVQMMYYEQAPAYVPFPTATAGGLAPDEYLDKNNQQLRSLYGVSFGGSLNTGGLPQTGVYGLVRVITPPQRTPYQPPVG